VAEREPDFSGVGRAWEMRMGPQARPDQAATIVGYVVTGPFHPMWSWWMVAVIHLRKIPGTHPAHKHYPEAEYELMIVSLDPETPPDLAETFPQEIRQLLPPDADYRERWTSAIASTVTHYREGRHGSGAQG
jgi:hypothetical protein